MEDWEGEMSAGELQNHLNRFEATIDGKESHYFDVYVLEGIIDFLIERNQYKKAYRAIELGQQLHPGSTSILVKEGLFFLHFGKLSKAAEIIKTLQVMEPHNETVLLMCAQLYGLRKDSEKSVQYYLKALETINEVEPEIYIDLALELQNLKRFGDSIHYLKRVVADYPENETALHEIAYCYDIMDDLKGAIAFFKKFIDEHPYSDLAWFLLGASYIKYGDIPEALNALDYCTIINAENSAAWFTKGHCHQEIDETSEALHCYLECLKFDLPQADLHTVIGECYEEMDLLPEAKLHYLKALDISPEHGDAYLGLGVILDLEGKLAEGVAYLKKAIETNDENPTYWHVYAEALKKLEDYELSEEAFTRRVELDVLNEQMWADFADLYFKADGTAERAIDKINEGLVFIPEDDLLLSRKIVYLTTLGNEPLLTQCFVQTHLAYGSAFIAEIKSYFPQYSQYPVLNELIDLHQA